FLSSPVIRNIVGQVKSSFSMREVMDEKKVLLLNLAKGRIGEDNSALLGAMLITKIQMAAMSRVDIPEEERRDFYLYVDEFQNFATESFANILSEARKYRLNLIIAHQYIEQLDELVQAAVFGNVGTMMLFRIGGTDAEALVAEFEPYFMEEDLVNLGKYEVYMKLMIDGIASQPFSATTLPPISGKTDNKEKVIKVSRERYTTSRAVVEEKIIRWSEAGRGEDSDEGTRASARFAPARDRGPAPARPSIPRPNHGDSQGTPGARPLHGFDPPRNDKKKDTLFVADCAICGDETELSFKPDGSRPVYCKSCLKKVRSGEIPRPERKEDSRRRHDGASRPKPKIPGSDMEASGPSLSLSDALSQGVQKFQG
ncbi:MAG: type IV secretion system DNA-binding domain-containing protein, partial [Parcubacteria group bacterium]|nr:type IV secretion system DNA-binding domain-containing protein [Parcubacteria group bacterium]